MGAESKIEAYFADRIKKDGGEIRKVKWIGRRGAPDRFAAVYYWNGFVEFKAPGEKLQEHQEREIEKLRGLGVNVAVIDTYEGVDQFISNCKRIHRYKESGNMRDLIT